MLLKLNDRSEAVKAMQKGLGLSADGNFGPMTLNAVKEFQASKKLVVDGLAGPGTLVALLGAEPKIHTLTKAEFVSCGNILNCHPGMIEALALKETNGAAFLADNRPKILLERHWVYKRMAIVRKPGETQASVNALRDRFAANNPDICNKTAGGYKGGAAEYDRLARVRAVSDTAGLESASWGQFQVMGFNATSIGYASVQEFTRLMYHGVDQHLNSLAYFILNTPKALRGIRNQDFAMLAEAYNGPKYKINNYDTDLKKHFDKVKSKY